MRGKSTFMRSSSYVHTESISKRVSFWDWKSLAFGALGCHWLRSDNAQLSGWKIRCSIPPTHKLYGVTSAGLMQDIDNRRDGRNEFHRGRGPHRYRANCCRIVREAFLKSANYLTNHQSHTGMSEIKAYHSGILVSRWAILCSKLSKQKARSDLACFNPLGHGTNWTQMGLHFVERVDIKGWTSGIIDSA